MIPICRPSLEQWCLFCKLTETIPVYLIMSTFWQEKTLFHVVVTSFQAASDHRHLNCYPASLFIYLFLLLFFLPLNLILKYVSYSAEISHLAVGCREGISLLVSDWLSQLSLCWAQSLLSDTAAHSHRQKYPANWMAHVRHSPRGTALCVSVCVQQKDRQWVKAKQRQEKEGKKGRTV